MNDKIFGPTKVGVVGPAPPVLKSLAIHLNHYSSQQCLESLREGLGASLP